MDAAAHALLQDAAPTHPLATGRFRPYASTKHRVTRGRYITSNDRRGYIPVYEYPLNGQWIMMDIDDGYILWTGIWKALGNAKADIVKMLESQPDLAPQLRRVRGGYLKIQGTWMPYEVALRLARRVAWTIREDLIPLFGPIFPSTCLAPDQPGYGQILGNQQGRRRGRRAALPLPMSVTLPPPHSSDVSSGFPGQQTQQGGNPGPSSQPSLAAVAAGEHVITQHVHPSQIAIAGPSGSRYPEYLDSGRYTGESSSSTGYYRSTGQPHASDTAPHAYGLSPMGPPPPSTVFTRPGSAGEQLQFTVSPSSGPVRDSVRYSSAYTPGTRFSPYLPAPHAHHRPASLAAPAFARATLIDLPPLTIPTTRARATSRMSLTRLTTDSSLGLVDAAQGTSTSASAPAIATAPLSAALGESIVLPPIQPHTPTAAPYGASRQRSGSLYSSDSGTPYSLPPISALDEPPPHFSGDGAPRQLDSAAVLKRLALDDDIVGRSRAGSFVAPEDHESNHRDEDGNTFTVARPTQEQLWTRRRSLSAPPLHLDIFPKTRHAWSDAPNMSLRTSTMSTSMTTFLRYNPDSSVASPLTSYSTDNSRYGRGYPNERPPPGLSGLGSEPFTRPEGGQGPVRPAGRFSPDYVLEGEMSTRSRTPGRVFSDDHQQGREERPLSPHSRARIPAESSVPGVIGRVEGHIGRIRGDGGDSGDRTPRQISTPMPTDSWRPRTHLRPPTPSSRSRAHLSSPPYAPTPAHAQTSPRLTADLASYRFGGGTASSPKDGPRQPALSALGDRKERELTDVEMDTDACFHSSSMGQTQRTEDSW